ncbi:MAG: hypothetical protein M3406_15255 [Chloroflexota bacterium]|nr:hypothetical protein [Chloroflexota bacterium]
MSASIDDVRVSILAPRELVFEMAAAVGGALPDGPPHASELVSRDGNVLVVRYSAPAPFRFFGFLEEVTLTPSTRIDYRVLEGPLDRVEEWLDFEFADGLTTVTYGGIVEHRLPFVARYIAVPAYRAYMKRTLAALKKASELRAARSRRYPKPADSS